MRILHVNNLNQVAKIYACELTRRGHSVEVYEPSFSGGLSPLPIKLALMPGRILHFRHVIPKLNTNYFDIAHIHWSSYGILGLMGDIPFIVHCRGDDVRDRLTQPFFRPILIAILRRAAAVLCSTPDLLSIVKPIRSDVIFSPAPVDTKRFIPEKTLKYSSKAVKNILLFSRLDPDKGAGIALQGIACFAQRHPDVHVQVLDWGILKETYKRQYAQSFEFIPLVTPDKVECLIQSADVIVGQLALGVLGLSELQAMSCAKPVIASFRYQNAYPVSPPLCQAATSEEVDGHLENLFRQPEAAVMLGEKAREWVLSYHDYQVLAYEIEKLYQAIIGGNGLCVA